MTEDAHNIVVNRIRRAFRPTVAIYTSDGAEQTCQKNSLSFAQILLPFAQLQHDVQIKDVTNANAIASISKLDIDFRDVKKDAHLNVAALTHVIQTAAKEVDVDVKKASNAFELPSNFPWLEAYRDSLDRWMAPNENEFCRSYIACLLVVSTQDIDPIKSLQDLNQTQHTQQHSTQHSDDQYTTLPKWFNANTLKYHVLIHDSPAQSSEQADVIYNNMKQQYGSHSCTLLKINSNVPDSQNGAPDTWSSHIESSSHVLTIALRETSSSLSPEPIAITRLAKTTFSVDGEDEHIANDGSAHALSTTDLSAIDGPLGDFNTTTSEVFKAPKRGIYLTTDDCERILSFVEDFVTKSLVPYVERQMRVLYDQMQSRKGFSKGLFDGLKKNRWFGGSSAMLPATGMMASPTHAASAATLTTVSSNVSPMPPQNQIDTAEGQLRRLADLAFLFQQYGFAFYVYNLLRKEQQNNSNSITFANICEMSALSAFNTGQLAIGKPYPQHHMDAAIRIYRDFGQSQPGLTIRATLFDVDIRRSQQRHEDAHALLVDASALSANDLYSAMLLEQAAVCLRDLNKIRRMSFRLILAGYRYNKALLKAHSLRCYSIALHNHRDIVNKKVYWRHAIDHIDYTRAHDLRQCAEPIEAIDKALNRLFSNRPVVEISTSCHLPTLHTLALLEYSQAVQQIKQSDTSYIPSLPFPHIDMRRIETFINFTQSDLAAYEQMGDGRRVNIRKSDDAFTSPNADDNVPWQEMYQAILQTSSGTSKEPHHLPTSFHNVYTDNSKIAQARPNESWRIRLPLINQLAVPVTISNQQLVVEGQHEILHQTPELLTLQAHQSAYQDMLLTPKAYGQYKVVAWTYTITVIVQREDKPAIVINGLQNLIVQGPRLNRTKQHKITPHYGPDFRLVLNVSNRGELGASVEIDLPALNPYDPLGVQPAFCGQIYPVQLVLRLRTNDNHSTPVINTHVCAWPCQSIALQDNVGTRLPAQVWEDQSEAGLSCDRRQVVWTLISDATPIHPQGQKSYTFLLKAPATQASHTIQLLFATRSLDKHGHEHLTTCYRTLRFITRPSVAIQARALVTNKRDTILCNTSVINRCDSSVVTIQPLRVSIVQPIDKVNEHCRWQQHKLVTTDNDSSMLLTGQSTNICSIMLLDRGKFYYDTQVTTLNLLKVKEADIVCNYGANLPWTPNVMLNSRDSRMHNPSDHYVVILWEASWPSPNNAKHKVTVLGESWASLVFSDHVESIPTIIISKLALRIEEEKRARTVVQENRSPISPVYSTTDKHPIGVSLVCQQRQPLKWNFDNGSCFVPISLYVERKSGTLDHTTTESNKFIFTINTSTTYIASQDHDQQLNTGTIFINGPTRKPLQLLPGELRKVDFELEIMEVGTYDLRQTVNIGYIGPGRSTTSISTPLPLTREQAPILNICQET